MPAKLSDFEPKLQPVYVTSGIGRCGTTLLMNYLALHPEIVSDFVYPYEYLASDYYLNIYKVLSLESSWETRQLNKYLDIEDIVAPNPYNNPALPVISMVPELKDFYKTENRIELKNFALKSIDRIYTILAEHQKKNSVSFFATKFSPGSVFDLSQELYQNPKPFFLVRDFRDIVVSSRAFNEKKGQQMLGRQMTDNDEEWLLWQARKIEKLLSYVKKYPKVPVLKYEDFILKEKESLKKLFGYIGIDSSDLVIDNIINTIKTSGAQQLAVHSTSSSKEKSIGRWQAELDPKTAEAANKYFAVALKEFGYS